MISLVFLFRFKIVIVFVSGTAAIDRSCLDISFNCSFDSKECCCGTNGNLSY